jgi:hypothetical protein
VVDEAILDAGAAGPIQLTRENVVHISGFIASSFIGTGGLI